MRHLVEFLSCTFVYNDSESGAVNLHKGQRHVIKHILCYMYSVFTFNE